MADIFSNILKGTGGLIGGAAQGIGQAHRGLQKALVPGYFENIESQRKLRKELQELQVALAAAPNPEAQAIIGRKWMEKHRPEVAKLISGSAQGWQPQEKTATPPWWTTQVPKEQWQEGAEISAGMKPRAVDPWTQFGRMADVEANLGVDPLTGKPRFPGLTKRISEQIESYRLPGMPPAQKEIEFTPEFGRKADSWLGEPKKKPTPPSATKSPYWSIFTGKFWKEAAKEVFPKAKPEAKPFAPKKPTVSDRRIQQTYKDMTELRSIMSKIEKEGNTKLYNEIRKKWLAYLEAVNTGREDEESSPSQILEFDEVKAYRK